MTREQIRQHFPNVELPTHHRPEHIAAVTAHMQEHEPLDMIDDWRGPVHKTAPHTMRRVFTMERIRVTETTVAMLWLALPEVRALQISGYVKSGRLNPSLVRRVWRALDLRSASTPVYVQVAHKASEAGIWQHTYRLPRAIPLAKHPDGRPIPHSVRPEVVRVIVGNPEPRTHFPVAEQPDRGMVTVTAKDGTIRETTPTDARQDFVTDAVKKERHSAAMVRYHASKRAALQQYAWLGQEVPT